MFHVVMIPASHRAEADGLQAWKAGMEKVGTLVSESFLNAVAVDAQDAVKQSSALSA